MNHILITPMKTEEEICGKAYDTRLALYDAGIKQWDTNMSLIMVLRGTK